MYSCTSKARVKLRTVTATRPRVLGDLWGLLFVGEVSPLAVTCGRLIASLRSQSRFTSALVQYVCIVCITSNDRRNEWKVVAVMACDGANVHIIVRGPDRQTDWERKKRVYRSSGVRFKRRTKWLLNECELVWKTCDSKRGASDW
jgi:hypothetical protein